MAKDGILVRVLGDYGPFSSMGKSIGYQVSIGDSSFLVDCGSPLFQQIGGHGLKTIKGLIITHCHDDHKRWFTDLSLFNRYAPDIPHKLSLFTSETINASPQAPLSIPVSAAIPGRWLTLPTMTTSIFSRSACGQCTGSSGEIPVEAPQRWW